MTEYESRSRAPDPGREEHAIETRALDRALWVRLDGDWARRKRVLHHLRRCGTCQQTWNQLPSVMDVLGALKPVAPPTELKRQILARLRAPPGPGSLLFPEQDRGP